MTRLLLLCFACSLSAQPVALKFDPDRSTVEFSLGAMLHTVHGTFQMKRGSLTMDPETGKASGELVVRAGSGESGNFSRDTKMQDSVLESNLYPEIVFRPDRIEGKFQREGHSDLQIHGIFTLHGIDHEITAPVAVDGEAGHYRAVVKFTIPYVKWGLKNPSTFVLRVSDKVEITARLTAR